MRALSNCTGEAALVAAVLNSQAARSGALPAALMRAYVGADHVVGLDVDRDSFDKFTMRSCIGGCLYQVVIHTNTQRGTAVQKARLTEPLVLRKHTVEAHTCGAYYRCHVLVRTTVVPSCPAPFIPVRTNLRTVRVGAGDHGNH